MRLVLNLHIDETLRSILNDAPVPVNWNPSYEPLTSVWWKADDATTINQSGGLVSTFADKRLNVDLVQTNETLRPSTGINTINNKNALTFVDGGDLMVSAGSQSVIREGSNVAIHVVGSFASTGTNLNRLIQVVTGTTSGFQIQRANLDGVRMQTYISGVVTNLTVNDILDNAPHVYSFCSYTSNSQMEIYVDGVLRGNIAIPVGNFDGASIVNNFMQMGGLFGEMFIVSGKAKDIQDIEIAQGYLAHEWGLQANLPLAHPYKEAKPQILFVPKVYEMINSYDQSWVALNGNNISKEVLRTPQKPNNAFMPEAPNIFLGGIVHDMTNQGRLVSMFESTPNVQSVTGPMVLRLLQENGNNGLYIARQSGEGSKSLEQLAKPTMSFYDGTSPFYEDMLHSWNQIKKIVQKDQNIVRQTYIYRCHGLDNSSDTYEQYLAKYIEFSNGISDDNLAIFGNVPKFLLVTQPGGTLSGMHPNVLAQKDYALQNTNFLAAYAGYAVEKHTDLLHYSTNGCLDLGDILALKKIAWDNGTKWHSPYFTNARLEGTTIILDVQGLYDVEANETVANMCHWDGGSLVDGLYTGGAPIANLGFEFVGAATIISVFVDARNVYIELSASVNGELTYAYTNTPRADGFTLNRGNVCSTWNKEGIITGTYTGNVLRDWVLPGKWTITI